MASYSLVTIKVYDINGNLIVTKTLNAGAVNVNSSANGNDSNTKLEISWLAGLAKTIY